MIKGTPNHPLPPKKPIFKPKKTKILNKEKKQILAILGVFGHQMITYSKHYHPSIKLSHAGQKYARLEPRMSPERLFVKKNKKPANESSVVFSHLQKLSRSTQVLKRRHRGKLLAFQGSRKPKFGLKKNCVLRKKKPKNGLKRARSHYQGGIGGQDGDQELEFFSRKKRRKFYSLKSKWQKSAKIEQNRGKKAARRSAVTSSRPRIKTTPASGVLAATNSKISETFKNLSKSQKLRNLGSGETIGSSGGMWGSKGGRSSSRSKNIFFVEPKMLESYVIPEIGKNDSIDLPNPKNLVRFSAKHPRLSSGYPTKTSGFNSGSKTVYEDMRLCLTKTGFQSKKKSFKGTKGTVMASSFVSNARNSQKTLNSTAEADNLKKAKKEGHCDELVNRLNKDLQRKFRRRAKGSVNEFRDQILRIMENGQFKARKFFILKINLLNKIFDKINFRRSIPDFKTPIFDFLGNSRVFQDFGYLGSFESNIVSQLQSLEDIDAYEQARDVSIPEKPILKLKHSTSVKFDSGAFQPPKSAQSPERGRAKLRNARSIEDLHRKRRKSIDKANPLTRSSYEYIKDFGAIRDFSERFELLRMLSRVLRFEESCLNFSQGRDLSRVVVDNDKLMSDLKQMDWRMAKRFFGNLIAG